MNTVISKDGTKIAYDQVGTGPAVILVGGAFSYRLFPGLVKLAGLLAPKFSVINYDRRGRGDSGDAASYAVEREVEDLKAIIDEVGGSASVFGLSSGGALALEAAASGLNITRLAVYEPPFMVGEHVEKAPKDDAAKLNQYIETGRRGAAVRHFLKNMGMPGFLITIMSLTPVWSNLKAVAHTLAYDATIMGNYSLPEHLSSVATPTCVIGGEKSDIRLRNGLKALAEVLPNNEYRLLEGQSHNVSMDVLAPVMAEFFAR